MNRNEEIAPPVGSLQTGAQRDSAIPDETVKDTEHAAHNFPSEKTPIVNDNAASTTTVCTRTYERIDSQFT